MKHIRRYTALSVLALALTLTATGCGGKGKGYLPAPPSHHSQQSPGH